jgi:hypothetical protein
MMRISVLRFSLLIGFAAVLGIGSSRAQNTPVQPQTTQAPFTLPPDFESALKNSQRGVDEMPPPDLPHQGGAIGSGAPPDLPHSEMPRGGSPSPDLPHAAPPR